MSDCEWGFPVPPEQVDLERIHRELGGMPAIYAYSYLEQLYLKAPRTYARFREWGKARGISSFNWEYDPHGRFASKPSRAVQFDVMAETGGSIETDGRPGGD